MKNIVLARIDDRLLHGQVVVSWIPYIKANEVVVVDNEYAEDEFMSELIKHAAPENIKVNLFGAAAAADYLKGEDDGSRILILSRYIENIEELINSNVEIKCVNVGGLGNVKGRERFVNSIHLSSRELEILKDIAGKNISVEIKMLPNDKTVSVE
jgi:PTS system mannose-specific IIB component